MTTYPELVAKIRSQWERGLITQAEYESEVIYLAQCEVNRLAPYRVTLTWNELGYMSSISHCDSLESLHKLIDDYIDGYKLSSIKRIDVTGGSYVEIYMVDGKAESTCTVVVDKRQKF